MRIKFRRGSWIIAPILLLSFFVNPTARAADNSHLVFAWQSATVYQDVAVDLNGSSALTLTVSAAETQDWKTSSDSLNIGIELRGSGGGLIYSHSTGLVSIDSTEFSDYSISITAAGVGNGGWNSAVTARAFIIGQDGEFWAGNYGTRVDTASLKLDGQELLSNTDFNNQTSWTSSLGWQTCSGGAGFKPCTSNPVVPTTTTIPINNSSYSLTDRMVWATADEGWNMSLFAPGGGTFDRVVFASYGTPSGSNGEFTQGWCHASNSILKLAQTFIGQSSSSISASNGIFGDPCGGTYKRLYVVLSYTGGLPNTTTTTTTTLPTCGPYSDITVTGSRSGGAVWGSGPYTDDSDMNVAAVHAGLVDPGQTAVLHPVNVYYHASYPGNLQNGVNTTDWLSPWCGYDLELVSPSTTVPATTTSTTTTDVPVSTGTTTTTQPEELPIPTTTSPQTQDTSDITNSSIPTETSSPIGDTTIPGTSPKTTLPEPETSTTDAPAFTSIPETLNTESTAAVNDLKTESLSADELTSAVADILDSVQSADELGTVVNSLLDKPLTDEQFSAVIDEVLSGPLSSDEISAVLDAVFDEPLSDEKFDEVISAVLDEPLSDEQFAAVVDSLESDSITAEQVSSAVDIVLEAGVTEQQATELATSAKVLESIDGEQAAELFDAVDIAAITPEEAEKIVAAVQDAPAEVRDAFEENINVFEGAVDTYVPLDSKVTVSVRRVVIAATTVLSITAVPTSQPIGGSSGGSAGDSPDGSSGDNRRRRK